MSQDPKEGNSEKTPPPAGRAPRKEVELFPGVSDKRMSSLPVPAAAGGSRLNTQISIFSPSTFDEALEIVERLRGRAATTISLEKMRKVDASRLVDFVSGASAALDGDFHRLTEQVYVFCPANIKIVAPSKQAIAKGAPKSFDFLFSDALMDKSGMGRAWQSK